MKQTTIAAALPLMMTSGAAMAWDASPQGDAVETTTLALFTGSQKYNRCPRFRVIDAATKAEFAAADMVGPAGTPDDPTDDLLWPEDGKGGGGTSMYADEYNKNPSAFCKMAWDRLGPNGTYKRQMLEAK
jgi:hypothetical protein